MNKCVVSFAFGFYVCHGLYLYGFGGPEVLGVSVCVLFGWLASYPAVWLVEWVGGRLDRLIGKRKKSYNSTDNESDDRKKENRII